MRTWPLLFALGCTTITTDTPEGVARAWFRAAENGNLAGTARHVAPGCEDAPVAKGSPVRLLGAPTKVEHLVLTMAPDGPDRAIVKYSYDGTVDREAGTVKTKLFGNDVTITTGDIHVEIGLIESELLLEKFDGHWKIACPMYEAFRRQ